MSVAPPTLAAPDPPDVPDGVVVSRWPAWKPWFAVLALIAGLGLALAGAIVVYVAASVAGADVSPAPPAVDISATALQDLAFIAAAVLFAAMTQPPRPEQFGLRPTRFWRALGWAALGYVTFVVLAGAWSLALHLHNEDDVVKQLGADESEAARIAVAVLVCVVAPVAEEFFFRGFFFSALRNWKGLWPAAIITGLVFGGVHAGSAPVEFLLPLALLGFIFCLVYEKTGSLYPCMGLHCFNNSLAFGQSVHWHGEIAILLVGSLAAITGLALLVQRVWQPG